MTYTLRFLPDVEEDVHEIPVLLESNSKTEERQKDPNGRMRPRVYIDTSVVGGCFDEQFAVWSLKLSREGPAMGIFNGTI